LTDQDVFSLFSGAIVLIEQSGAILTSSAICDGNRVREVCIALSIIFKRLYLIK
jgi:hypothetical protein